MKAVFFQWCCAGLMAAAFLPQELPGADLRGVVTDEHGKPVQRAHVLPATAGVREGTSPLCPSCYPDCAKSATTDAEGRFVIADVDDTLVFNVLVAASGFRAAYARGSDPRKGEVTVKLTRTSPETTALQGRVLDSEGKPVFGALIEPGWYEKGDRSSIGGFPGDNLAVSDRDGHFELVTTSSEVKRIGVKISAPQLARKVFQPLSVGQELHEYRLDRGVTVRGRLVRHGKAVSNANVSLVQVDRNAETFVGIQTIGTDIDGKFELTNVPSGDFWTLSACRDTLPENGVTASVPVATTSPDTSVDLFDLEVEEAVVITGRVRLADDRSIPPGTRVLIDREKDWDPQTRVLEENGEFRFSARAGDQMTFHVRVPGYTDRVAGDHGSATRARLDVTADTTTMEIALDREDDPSPEKTLTGLVQTPEGRPAAGAKVFLLFPQRVLVVENGTIDPKAGEIPQTTTDAQGRFALKGPFRENLKRAQLLALAESGLAEVPAGNNSVIALTPWVTIRGTARHGKDPLAGQTVKVTFPRYQDNNEPRIFFQATTQTGEDGAFVINRAVPGFARIGTVLGKKGFEDVYFQQVGVELAAGRDARLDLGGEGATVKGKIAIPEEVRDRMETTDAIGRLKRIARPDAVAAPNRRLHLREPEYGFNVAPDGSFEISDVASGIYVLSATFPGQKPSQFPHLPESVGDVSAQVTVAPGVREVVVENTIFHVRKPALAVGDKLPEFTVTSDRGQSLSTDSFKGRPCVVVFAMEHRDSDLFRALAALPSDSKPFLLHVAQGPLKSGNLPGWETVSGNEAHKTAQAFGVQMWPTYYVVSRDGHIVCREGPEPDAIRKIIQALAACKS